MEEIRSSETSLLTRVKRCIIPKETFFTVAALNLKSYLFLFCLEDVPVYVKKAKAIPVTGYGSPHGFPVKYEHHLHIKCKVIPVKSREGPPMFPVRSKYLHVRNKAMPVTGRGGPNVCFLRGTNIVYI
jgi:hypothetical protein